jgi:bifunctional lysine-specific demethylase and histidyl-hydroxylase MINA
MSRLDLPSLLAPIGIEKFFAEYWQQEPLVITRDDPNFYTGLPTSSDFEFMLSSLTDPQGGWFSLVKERARPPDDSMLTEEKVLNLSEVYDALSQGYSLLLNQVQKRHRLTGLMCRKLEMTLSEYGVTLARHIGANGYLSPGDSQGFSIHYDSHDVFILQLEGRKHWRLYSRHVKFPVEPLPAPIPKQEAGIPQREFMVAPGDFIYIPRGFLHDAETGKESSLHITLSVECVTWRDLIAEVLSSDPRFRESLPRYFTAKYGVRRSERQELASLVSGIATSPQVPSALSRVTGRLLSNLEALPNGGFACIEDSMSLRPNAWVGLADGVFGRVEARRDAAVLHLPGMSLSASPGMAPSFRYLLKCSTFRPQDLPIKSRPAEKLKFIRELMLAGYVIRKRKPNRETSGRRGKTVFDS